MTFPAPVDTFTLRGRGTVHVTHVPEDTTRDALNALVGEIVTLGGRPFRVSGVETYAIERQTKLAACGLLGEFLPAIATEPPP